MKTTRIGLILAALAILPALSSAVEAAWSIAAGSASAGAGELVDIPIMLDTGGVSISAIAFAVEWDSEKLLLAGDPAAGSKVDLPAPAHFTSSSWVSTSGSSVGITVYDRVRPIESLPDGPVASLRFRVRPGTAGFAPVTVRAGSLSASSPDGHLVTGARVVAGGVSIRSTSPSLHLMPADVHFGSIPVGMTEKRTAIVINAGSGILTLREIRLEGSPDFSLKGIPLPLEIEAGSSVQVELSFSPRERGEAFSRLVVVSSEAGTASLALRGAGSEGELYYDRRLIVPAVASLAGGDGSRWLSTLHLYNSGSSPAGARLRLIRTGQPELHSEIELTIEAGHSVGWSDLLGDLFDVEGISGALQIDTTTDALVVRSSTYNEVGDGGRIAQSVPVLARTDLFHTGEEARLIGLEKSARRRTNVTVMNLGRTTATLIVELRDGSGVLLDTMSLSLEPNQIAPVIPLIDRLEQDASDLVILVRATTPDAEFFVYSSTVDRRTGAPLFQSPR